MDLRQAIDAVRRVMTKKKFDRQIMGETSALPFMKIKDSQTKAA